MRNDYHQPDLDGSEPDEPLRCEACGECLNEDDVVLVQGIVPDMLGNLVLLNVCPACVPDYQRDPILTRGQSCLEWSPLAKLPPDYWATLYLEMGAAWAARTEPAEVWAVLRDHLYEGRMIAFEYFRRHYLVSDDDDLPF